MSSKFLILCISDKLTLWHICAEHKKMKKSVRKALVISGLAIALGTTGLTLDANASTNSQNNIQCSHQQRIMRSRKAENNMRLYFKRRNISAEVTAIAANSLTATNNSKTYTLKISPETRLLNSKWEKINFSDIKVGDQIKVSGNITDTIITAKKIRDISL